MQQTITAEDLAIIVACNSRETLDACLSRSPDVEAHRVPIIVVEGARCMGEAYNRGLDQTDRRICVFAHQDVYLPRGWLDRALETLNDLSVQYPGWEVAGPIGLHHGVLHGRVFDTAFDQEVGSDNARRPAPVDTFDELLLILNRRPGYRFDEELPHFHLYGTDMAQTALAAGRGAYAVDMPVVHNARMVDSLRGGYALAWRYARRKWWERLPIHTSASTLSRNPVALWKAQWAMRQRPARTDEPLPDAVAAARAAGYE